jgi:hypothetical protein
VVLANDLGERGGPQPIRKRSVDVGYRWRRGFRGAEQVIGFWHLGTIAGMRRLGEGGVVKQRRNGLFDRRWVNTDAGLIPTLG